MSGQVGGQGAYVNNPGQLDDLRMQGLGFGRAGAEQLARQEYRQRMDLMGVQNLAGVGNMIDPMVAGVGNGMPQQNLAQNKGYNLQNDQQLQMATPTPLPFDDQFEKVKHLQGVASSLPPGMFEQQEQMYMQLQQMSPQLIESFRPSSSLYGGVPDNPILNRMNIYRQRDRENRMYAFV